MRYENKNILITPLDWGLGHAGRCIPLVRRLIKSNNKIFLAGCGDSLSVLKSEFPDLQTFELPSYKITYSRNFLVFRLLLSSFSFFKTIRKEKGCIKRIVNEMNIQLIISDNRYGCHHKSVESIFISHQIRILLPRKLRVFEKLVFYLNRKMIGNFNSCWIPDIESASNLTGKLSHSYKIRNCKFIGILSRFEDMKLYKVSNYDILVLLSGPEPLRSDLEKILTKALSGIDAKICIVRGSSTQSKDSFPQNFTVYNLAKGDELHALIAGAKKIIARSGYSTIMDLAYLEKDAILIPTPGQTEQEYLAEYLSAKPNFKTIKQKDAGSISNILWDNGVTQSK